ncbi:YcaO-like family protein [Streptomyces sp. NPDC093707]|uniref:YcaO-like family protein n=1 Tax=Streptomyces sp. NPDC093707 TaxID=3154984 RepID=UPI00344C537D
MLVDIGVLSHGEPNRTESDYPLHLVGAYDVCRRDALQRGAGEAVERYALLPCPEAGPRLFHVSAAELGAEALPFSDPWAALGHPDANEIPLDWYRGSRLIDGSPVLVPAPLADWTGAPGPSSEADYAETILFDPSPSGAASGAGHEHATRSALLEIIERDAVIVAWYAQLALAAVDINQIVTAAAPTLHRRSLRTLLDGARAKGLTPVFARIPTCTPDLACTICVIVDRDGGPLGAVGAKASGDGVRALLGALQEAMQIHELLARMRSRLTPPSPGANVVRHDVDRAWAWTMPKTVDALERWTATFRVEAWDPPRTTPDLATLVTGLSADGANPVVVSLTERLPAAVRDLGWSAVKVLCPGYQPLRIDERPIFSLHRERIHSAARRTGRASALPATEVFPLPHPLI